MKPWLLTLAACAQTAVHTASLDTSSPVSLVASFTPATGYAPRASLVLGPDSALYGTTWKGGNGCGTVYRVDGSGITLVHTFAALDATKHNADGCEPIAPVSFNGGRLYAVLRSGGPAGNPTRPGPGAITSMLPDGSDVKLEHAFTGGADGASPAGALVWNGAIAFGSTPQGLYHFNTGAISYVTGLAAPGPRNAYGSPVLDINGNLVAWAAFGGANGTGGIVLVANGIARTIYDFPSYSFAGNTDNAPLQSAMLASDGAIYLADEYGGVSGTGMIVKVERTATVIHEFEGAPVNTPTGHYANVSGAQPLGTLVEVGSWLYGTTFYGGTYGTGTIFRIGKDGRGFSTLYAFPAPSSSGMCYPASGLTVGADGALYGTTFLCGASGGGTVYRFEVQ